MKAAASTTVRPLRRSYMRWSGGPARRGKSTGPLPPNPTEPLDKGSPTLQKGAAFSLKSRRTLVSMDRVLPQPTPETQHFWDGCKAGELLLQRCSECSKPYFPPRPFCPACGSRNVEVFKAAGKGRLYSYVINHRPRPDMGTEPHSIAVVELDEGVRMMTNIVDCPQTPQALVLDMPVEVKFTNFGAQTLPLFKPAGA